MSGDRFPEPRMREEFRVALRQKLLLEAQTALDPANGRGTSWTAWLTTRTFARPAVALGAAAIILAAGAGSAAADSVSGDPAFAIKKAVEDVQVALTFDDVQRVQLLAQITDRRLAELEQVAERTDKAPTASQEYADAVSRFRAAVDALQQAAPQDKADAAQEVADAARAKHDAVLDAIEQRVPDEAKPALERAKEEEHQDKGKGRGDGTGGTVGPNPTRTQEPTRTPRATETARSTRR